MQKRSQAAKQFENAFRLYLPASICQCCQAAEESCDLSYTDRRHIVRVHTGIIPQNPVEPLQLIIISWVVKQNKVRYRAPAVK